MNKYIYPMALAATALIATACSDVEETTSVVEEQIPGSKNDRIEFSMSDGTTQTRAGFTGADTRIVARFQSDEKDGSGVRYTRTVLKAAKDATGGATGFSKVTYYTSDNTRYWDDAFGRKGQISVYAVAIPNSADDSKLTDTKLAGDNTWAAEGSPNNSIQWDVTYGTQTTTTLDAEDLVYSNNIKDGGKNGRYVWSYTSPEGYPTDNGRADGHDNGRMVFTQKGGAAESDAGHFDKGHLVFTHALSRLTITLVEGDGFDKTSDNKDNDFKFTNSANIKLLQMPYTGTLNLKDGSWGTISTKDIEKLISSSATANKADETFSAQVIPGYKFYQDGTANVMQFVIDNSTYYVTQKQIFDALNVAANIEGTTPLITVKTGTDSKQYIEMEQGKNYQLTITVKKTAIDNITATLADWVDVAGEMSIDNSHGIVLSLKTSGNACDKDIDLYRLADDNAGYDDDKFEFDYQGKNWFGNYATDENHKTTLEHSAQANGKWTTPWFFDSNKTYYHFRTVNKGTVIRGNNDAQNDYFEIKAGKQADEDPHWGAPMQAKDGITWLKYDTENGYEAHLRPAIGATNDDNPIAIQELHMMSNINVVLKTVEGAGKVKLLYEDSSDPIGTIVEITRLAKTGTVEMGRGLVTPVAPADYNDSRVVMTTPSANDYYETDGIKTKPYTYAVVPQPLYRWTNPTEKESDDYYVGIFIKTPDNNQYYIVKKFSEIAAVTVSDNRDVVENEKIDRWYPGHNYTYTFTLSKKGIENITCVVAEWINVTGQNQDITLED